MIRHLYIRNFVLIDELNLDFDDGFSAFIGETGAGKSILIDAISLLKADRASASLVSKGAEKAIVEGTFDLSRDSHACEVLADAGFEVEQDEVTFTREITSGGKSTVRIDHRIATLSILKEVLQNEIDIHGQRDSQYLLNVSSHIHLLDHYLNDSSLLKQVADSFSVYDRLVKERDAALTETYNENDLEYFNFEISEIEEAKLSEGEEEELLAKEKQYKAVKASFDKLNGILDLFDNSVSEPLYELNRSVQGLEDSDVLTVAKTEISDSYYNLNDAMDTLRKSLEDMDLSEDDVNEMEERLFTIQKMKRKYGRTIPDILEKKKELEEQVERISHRKEYLEKMETKIHDAYAVYEKAAIQLSKLRKKGAPSLDSLVAANLKDLVLPNARFHTEIVQAKPSASGMDRVEFLISMNQGEDLKPLSRTASGGELSRLMLGLKQIFSKLQGIQTVIFDEIDTGVSGPVANAIGKKMRAISEDCQVFSVTHLAPVAACAKHAYLVSKEESSGRTHTHVTPLKQKEFIEQLALISSGKVTEASRAAARELYRSSQE